MWSGRAAKTDWEALARRPLNYSQIGATAHPELPDGFHHIRRRERLDVATSFDDAAIALSNWAVHRSAGLRVQARGPAATPNTDVVLGLGPIRAACRIVYVLNEPDRRGFAYGTLQGHPESGEEYFGVHRESDGSTFAEIAAFSRPARWWSRFGAIAAGKVQQRITDRYLAALRTANLSSIR
jgi:uncharacterized protein (UPF0548 family)